MGVWIKFGEEPVSGKNFGDGVSFADAATITEAVRVEGLGRSFEF